MQNHTSATLQRETNLQLQQHEANHSKEYSMNRECNEKISQIIKALLTSQQI
jgi:hypothetical protein